MFLGLVLMCFNNEPVSAYTCYTYNSPVLFETEEECMDSLIGFLNTEELIAILELDNVEDAQCVKLGAGERV